MARSLPTPPGYDDLSVDEKVDYIQSLWDRIGAHPENVSVPGWHREIISERLKAHEERPHERRPWEDVRQELLDKLQQRRSNR